MNENEVVEECPYPSLDHAIWECEWPGGDGYELAKWLRLQADELDRAEYEVRVEMQADGFGPVGDEE